MRERASQFFEGLHQRGAATYGSLQGRHTCHACHMGQWRARHCVSGRLADNAALPPIGLRPLPCRRLILRSCTAIDAPVQVRQSGLPEWLMAAQP